MKCLRMLIAGLAVAMLGDWMPTLADDAVVNTQQVISTLVGGWNCNPRTKANGGGGAASARFEKINAALTQAEGQAPWPSSWHLGNGVHFIFVDGHLKFVSADIDGVVYAALVSPRGTTVNGPLWQGPIDDGY